MRVKVFLSIFALLVAALLTFFIAACMLKLFFSHNAALSPLLDAPKITDPARAAGHENEIVWLYGHLASQGEKALSAPLSENKCLYYRYEKYEVRWEEDSDGDSYQAYYLVESDEKIITMVLQIGTIEFTIIPRNMTYYNLEKSSDYNRTIDQTEYNFREYSIPVGNAAWVIGKLSNGGLDPTDRGAIICLGSADFLFRQLKGEIGPLLYLSLLFFVLGLGFSGGFLYLLLRNRLPLWQKGDVVVALTLPLYFWLFGGALLIVFAQSTLFAAIILGSLLGFFCNFPYLALIASGDCRPKPLAAVILFAASIGMFVPGVYLLNESFFLMSNWFPRLFFGLMLVAGAITLISLYRFVIARK